MDYVAGDHVGIHTANPPEAVEEAARLLGLPLDTVFSLEASDSSSPDIDNPFPGQSCLAATLACLLQPPGLVFGSGPRLYHCLRHEGVQDMLAACSELV